MGHEKEVHEAASSQVIKDPVCGMNVSADSAFGKQEPGGRTFYFCSSGCLEKFSSDPSKYAAK